MEILSNEIRPWHLEKLTDEKIPHYSEFKGRPLLILFFYIGCPGCTARAIPFANRMVYEHKSKINVLGIHSNFEGPEFSNEDIINTLNSLYVRFSVFKDLGLATTFHNYQAAGTPHWILVDKDSKVIQSIFGSDPNRALLRLDYAINEQVNN